MKKIIVAMLAVTVLGAVAIPSHADTGNSQTGTNVSTIDGNGNSVRQNNTQRIDSGRRGRGDEANIQDGLNDSDVRGNRNRVDQNNDQRVRSGRR
jgi:acid phosphatase class B